MEDQIISDGFGDVLTLAEAVRVVDVAIAATAAADRAERERAEAVPARRPA